MYWKSLSAFGFDLNLLAVGAAPALQVEADLQLLHTGQQQIQQAQQNMAMQMQQMQQNFQQGQAQIQQNMAMQMQQMQQVIQQGQAEIQEELVHLGNLSRIGSHNSMARAFNGTAQQQNAELMPLQSDVLGHVSLFAKSIYASQVPAMRGGM